MLGVKRFFALAAIAVPLSLTAQPLQRYAHRTCGYSFQHFAGWKVMAGDDERRPCEGLVAPPCDDAPSLWIDAGGGGVEDALKWPGLWRGDESVKRRGKRRDLPADA